MTDKKGWKTLDEIDAQLRAEGRYDEVMRRQEDKLADAAARAAEWRKAEAPIVDELKESGFEIKTVWDLVNSPNTYSTAVPILAKHLERPYPSRVREGIARALAVKEARQFRPMLVRLYIEETAPDAKMGLAAALNVTTDDSTIDETIALVRDTKHGPSRGLLLAALMRSRHPRAGDARGAQRRSRHRAGGPRPAPTVRAGWAEPSPKSSEPSTRGTSHRKCAAPL